MSGKFSNEPMLEIFVFETTQQIDELEKYFLYGEKINCYNETAINKIFRIRNTFKGSSIMMFKNKSSMAQSMEDLFYFP